MRRRIGFACLCVALGAISTVAVAWGLEMTVPFPSKPVEKSRAWENNRSSQWSFTLNYALGSLWVTSRRVMMSPEALHELEYLEATYGRQPDQFGTPPEHVPQFTGLHEPLPEFLSGQFNPEIRHIVAHGWPALALCAELRDPGLKQQYTRQDVQSWTHHGWVMTSWSLYWLQRPYLFIPLRPLWPGFAFDTAFYAAVWWVVLAAPFALRRLIRRRRGLCGGCGYDLRGRGAAHERCPECGSSLKRAAASSRAAA